MDFKKLLETPIYKDPIDVPRCTFTTTYDPLSMNYLGSYEVCDYIMKGINNSLHYDFYIHPYFKIKKVIFNKPATIVYWQDGTKTVVKCGKRETYDKEKGLALCFMKKALNNKGNYNNLFRKYIKENK